jgi:nucleotide-binding universal stress UspA family protein
MSSTILCAIADDDCLEDVVATGRILAASGGLRPVFVHVAQCARLAPIPVGYGLGAGAGAAATAYVLDAPQQAREVSAALVEAADLWDDPTILATGDPATELDRIGREHDAALVVAGTHGRGLHRRDAAQQHLAKPRPHRQPPRRARPARRRARARGTHRVRGRPGHGAPRPNRRARRAPGRRNRAAARARARAARWSSPPQSTGPCWH